MNVWLAISLVLAVAAIYMFTIETYCVAFKLTGMATKKIKFQVASLFTSSGFTTEESELIVNDDRRRRIAVACMYTGHIFSVLIMGLVINIFFSIGISISGGPKEINFTEWYFIVFYVAAGFFLLMLLIKIPPINKRFQKFLETIAINSSRKNRKTNIMTVLDMYGKYAIAEVILNIIPEFAREVPLHQMGLTKKYSINVLSIKRGKRILEVTKDTMFRKGDVLVIYGLSNDITEAFVNSLNKESTAITVDKTNEITLVNNYGPNALVEVYVDEVPQELENVKMQNSPLKVRYNITIGIIKRKDDYIYVDKDTIIQKGDTLTLFGPYKSIKLLFNNDDKDKTSIE